VADPDWTDPCAVLAWLRPQYFKAMAGLATVTLTHGDTTVTYGQANKRELQAFFRELQSQCDAAQGVKTHRRRAILGG